MPRRVQRLDGKGGQEMQPRASGLAQGRHHASHAGWNSNISSRRRAARSASGTSSYMKCVGSCAMRREFAPEDWSERLPRRLPDSPT